GAPQAPGRLLVLPGDERAVPGEPVEPGGVEEVQPARVLPAPVDGPVGAVDVAHALLGAAAPGGDLRRDAVEPCPGQRPDAVPGVGEGRLEQAEGGGVLTGEPRYEGGVGEHRAGQRVVTALLGGRERDLEQPGGASRLVEGEDGGPARQQRRPGGGVGQRLPYRPGPCG